MQGYYLKTWICDTNSIPANTNTIVYFNGWSDVESMISSSNGCAANTAWLNMKRYISFGGGLSTGSINEGNLARLVDAINAGRIDNYQGLALDIEVGSGNLYWAFENVINAARGRNIEVLVTTSHSAPTDVPDSESLMNNLIHNGKINYLSPQLYSSGSESSNNFDLTWHPDGQNRQVTWNSYSQSNAQFVPSVVASWMYGDAQGYFSTQGVTTRGYVVWL